MLPIKVCASELERHFTCSFNVSFRSLVPVKIHVINCSSSNGTSFPRDVIDPLKLDGFNLRNSNEMLHSIVEARFNISSWGSVA